MKIDKSGPASAFPVPLPILGRTPVILAEEHPQIPRASPLPYIKFTVISKKSMKSCLQIHKSMIYYYNL